MQGNRNENTPAIRPCNEIESVLDILQQNDKPKSSVNCKGCKWSEEVHQEVVFLLGQCLPGKGSATCHHQNVGYDMIYLQRENCRHNYCHQWHYDDNVMLFSYRIPLFLLTWISQHYFIGLILFWNVRNFKVDFAFVQSTGLLIVLLDQIILC